jgi:hypothetical protein
LGRDAAGGARRGHRERASTPVGRMERLTREQRLTSSVNGAPAFPRASLYSPFVNDAYHSRRTRRSSRTSPHLPPRDGCGSFSRSALGASRDDSFLLMNESRCAIGVRASRHAAVRHDLLSIASRAERRSIHERKCGSIIATCTSRPPASFDNDGSCRVQRL